MFRARASEKQRSCLKTVPRDDHSSKSQPKRAETDRERSLPSWPTSRPCAAPAVAGDGLVERDVEGRRAVGLAREVAEVDDDEGQGRDEEGVADEAPREEPEEEDDVGDEDAWAGNGRDVGQLCTTSSLGFVPVDFAHFGTSEHLSGRSQSAPCFPLGHMASRRPALK